MYKKGIKVGGNETMKRMFEFWRESANIWTDNPLMAGLYDWMRQSHGNHVTEWRDCNGEKNQ